MFSEANLVNRSTNILQYAVGQDQEPITAAFYKIAFVQVSHNKNIL